MVGLFRSQFVNDGDLAVARANSGVASIRSNSALPILGSA